MSADSIIIISILLILVFYLLSYAFITQHQKGKAFRRNGSLDKGSSIFWIVASIILIITFFTFASSNKLTIFQLGCFYLLFIFMFAMIYGIAEWHKEGVLENVDSSQKVSELKYLIMSIQTQTSLGYTTIRPKNVYVELLCCIQVLLGFIFYVFFISKALSKP